MCMQMESKKEETKRESAVFNAQDREYSICPRYHPSQHENIFCQTYVDILENELLKTLDWYSKEVSDIIFQQVNDDKHNC